MQAVRYSEVEGPLADAFNRATEDREPVIVKRQGREDAVIVALADYEQMKEFVHLFSSPANAAAIDEAIAQYDAGLGEVTTVARLRAEFGLAEEA